MNNNRTSAQACNTDKIESTNGNYEYSIHIRILSLIITASLLSTGCSNNLITLSDTSGTTPIETACTTEGTTISPDETAVSIEYIPEEFISLNIDQIDYNQFIIWCYGTRTTPSYSSSAWQAYYETGDYNSFEGVPGFDLSSVDFIQQNNLIDYPPTSRGTGVESGYFMYGMEDPEIITYIIDLYNYMNNTDLTTEGLTVDSFNFFNGLRPAWNAVCSFSWVDISNEPIRFNEDVLSQYAARDNMLTRAILLSLGRSFFIQEIPFSFFEEHGLVNETPFTQDDPWILYYTDPETSETSMNIWPIVQEAYSEAYTDEYIISLIEIADEPYAQEQHVAPYYYNNNCHIGSYDYDYFDVSFLTYEYVSYNYYDGYNWHHCYIVLPGLLEACRDLLPQVTINGIYCTRYNSFLYERAFHKTGDPLELYRDNSNGAITIRLSDEQQAMVVNAFENAGTPLQTDENGNIVPETPAHFREVYGVEYTEVLEAAGLM